MSALSTNGFSERIPYLRPRYYNPDVFGGNDSRGAPASIRLLNTKTSSRKKLTGVEQQIFDRLVSNNGYSDFLLQNVSFNDSEKTQIMHTFGDGYVNYFYGRNPRQMSLSGILVDDIANNWFYKFLIAYDKFLRGTNLARNFRLIQLTLPNLVLVGSILDLSYSQDSANDTLISFSMNFVIKEMSFISGTTEATSDTSTYNNVFAINPTASDFATLTQAEINRRTVANTSNLAYKMGVSQETVARLASGNAFEIMASEQAQSLYRAFAGDSKLTQMVKLYTKTKEAALASLTPVRSFIQRVTDALSSVTNFFRNITAQIYSLTQFFSNLPNSIASFTNRILSPLRALLDIPNAVSSVVYSINLIRDSVVQALGNIKNTFKEVSQVFNNARAVLMSAPDTFAAKLSAGSAAGEFESVASLGSYTSNVIDSEAVAVLQLLNQRTAESYSTLISSENTVDNSEVASIVAA